MARIFALLVLLVAWAFPMASAHAHIGHDKPKLELGKRPPAPREGPRGRASLSPQGAPLTLTRTGDGSFVAGFELKNVGDGPLQIYRVAIRGSEDGGARPPVGLGIQTLPKATTILRPGESRLYNVVWRPDQTQVTQAFAHVVVETDSAAPGASSYDPPAYLGVVADRRPLYLRHVLALAVLLPLLIGAAAVAARLRLAGGERALRLAALGIATVSVVLAIAPLLSFVRGIGTGDGNDGLQLIERTVVGGVDLFLAVDGITAPMLPIPAILLLASVLAAPEGRLVRLALLAAPLTSATTLLLAAQSLPLLAAGLVLTALFASMLTATWSERGRLRAGAFKMFVSGAIASAAFLLLTHTLSRAVPGIVGLDGTTQELAFALPDVARELVHGHAAPQLAVLGLPATKGIFVLAIVTAAALTLAAPFHRTAAEVGTEAEPCDAALAIGSLTLAGGFVLVRFGLLLSPEASRWGATAIAVIGLVTIAGAIVRAAVETDLRGLAGALPAATGGAVWVAASSLTPQGVQGAIAIAIARPVAAALLVLCAGALVSRSRDATLASWGGVGKSAPLLATALLAAVLATAGVPGGASFWGVWLGLVGSVGRDPVTAIALATGLAATAAAHTRLWKLLSAPPNPDWERAPSLEPFGGRVPDLRDGRDRAWAFVLVGTLALLTFSPRAWLGVTSHVILDILPIADPPGPTQVASGSLERSGSGTFPG